MKILPNISSKIDEITVQENKIDLLGKYTFQFDFEKKEFVADITGKVITTTNEQEMLKQVVDKILHDRRYKNLIYPNSYGNEIEFILSQDEPIEIIKHELKRVYEEALIYHPFIKNISNFIINSDGDKIICQFIVNGVNGVAINKIEELNYDSSNRL